MEHNQAGSDDRRKRRVGFFSLVSGYRIRDPLNRLTQRELSGFQDFSI